MVNLPRHSQARLRAQTKPGYTLNNIPRHGIVKPACGRRRSRAPPKTTSLGTAWLRYPPKPVCLSGTAEERPITPTNYFYFLNCFDFRLDFQQIPDNLFIKTISLGISSAQTRGCICLLSTQVFWRPKGEWINSNDSLSYHQHPEALPEFLQMG
jgi:hypothetical protein